jgi:hypothetical protein
MKNASESWRFFLLLFYCLIATTLSLLRPHIQASSDTRSFECTQRETQLSPGSDLNSF